MKSKYLLGHIRTVDNDEVYHIEIEDTEGILWWINDEPFELEYKTAGNMFIERECKNGNTEYKYMGTFYYDAVKDKYNIMTRKEYFERL